MSLHVQCTHLFPQHDFPVFCPSAKALESTDHQMWNHWDVVFRDDSHNRNASLHNLQIT